MKPRDLSSTSVQRAVLKRSVEHPTTVYPLALGALGAVGLVAFGASPIALGVAGLGLAGGASMWAYQYFKRGDTHAKLFIDGVRKVLVGERKAALSHLEREFEELREPTGLRQIAQLEEKFQNFERVLDRQLHEGELTHTRYLTIAEQVFLGGLDNLKAAALALRSISAIDPERIKEALQKAHATPGNTAVSELETRLDLRTRQLQQVSDLLAQNETAMTHLDHVTAKLANIKTTQGHGVMDMEEAMGELRDLIARTDRYSS